MHLFLHGFLGAPSDWDQVIARLPFPCTALDYPFDLESIAQPFHLVGYSMGGRIALQFAHRFPQKVLSLTLISTHLGLKTPEERSLRLLKDQELIKEILHSPIDQFLKSWYNQPLFQTLLAKMDICAMRRQQNPSLLIDMIQKYSLGLQPDLSTHLPPSTRLIVGELDHSYRAHYLSHPHTVIPKAGHAIHLEKPNELSNILCN